MMRMSDAPTSLDKFRKRKRRQSGSHTTLCRRGFHKWRFDDRKQFDVKEGKLISIERCERCGATRTRIS